MTYSLGLTSSNFVVSIRDCFCRKTTMARRNYKKYLDATVFCHQYRKPVEFTGKKNSTPVHVYKP